MNRTFLSFVLIACLAGPAMPVPAAEPAAETDQSEQRDQRLEQQIDEIDRQLDRLERTLKSARKEAQAEFKKKLPELREKEQQMRKDFVRLRESGRKAWQELEATLKEMQRAIDRAGKEEP